MSGKRLLRNVLAQTGSMNKMREEREMWRTRELELKSHWRDLRQWHAPRSMITRGRLLSDTLSTSPPPTSTRHHHHPEHTSPTDHTHSDEEEEWRGGEKEVGYWTRQLLKQEEADPTRWGHSGYKELYAEEFASSEGETSECDETKKRRHKCKRTDKTGDKKSKKIKKNSELSGSDGTHSGSTRHRRRRRRRGSSTLSSSKEVVVLKHKKRRKRRSLTGQEDSIRQKRKKRRCHT